MPGFSAATKTPLVVFTDLDGTLLDARTYSASAARPALDLLKARGVPVVFCSSKTAAEQRAIQVELGLIPAPFIVENGSAVIVPEAADLPVTDWPAALNIANERVRVLGQAAVEVRAGIQRAAAAAGIRVTGYFDLTTREVAELTGLEPAAADRARRRDYSETLVDNFSPEAWTSLEAAFFVEGLCSRHGGRFRTVMGATVDKGRAVRIVAGLFSAAAGRSVMTVGLGDGPNDESLLAAVDRPYLVARFDGTWARMENRRLRRVQQTGPQGWHAAILDVLAAD